MTETDAVIVANGIDLHVERQGDKGPAIVFLHYWGGSSRTWHHVTARLAPSCRTIAIDHRGWGRSDAPPAGYALADLAADALAVIGQLGLDRFVIVGHSMGGKVAQLMAAGRPAGLDGLVLVAPAPPTPLALPPVARDMMATAYASRHSVEHTIDQVLTATPLAPADRELVIEDSLRGAPQAKLAWPTATSREDISGLVGQIAVPTLVVCGAGDRVDSPAIIEAELMPRIPHARLTVLPEIGHLVPLEAPAALAAAIAEFVNGLKPRA